MSDEVATLKRELEALKLELEQERKKNVMVQGSHNDNPPQPERQRDKSVRPRRDGDKNDAGLKKPRIYVQHAAVGVRRGKWWLRDRQVLSRATQDEYSSVKVRETWTWSGRTVILDKIVRLDEEDEQVEQDKPELEEPKGSNSQQTSPAEVAAASNEALSLTAQPSKAVETSEAASRADQEVIDSKVEEVSPAKASDEMRESSALVASNE
ncbi:hypothetical protein PHPALM_31487 [Phytophthora palmivora]|uniref:Uncharacterized protein n=1 Tax=Phytophthora palmivora TaxID=4796 RepID=A0A2P4X2G4_9STRA|nr:hypothetical protein PHPALM_31487 [Phytophthora palmivora]